MLANHEENPIAREGLSCYAARQADMYRSIIQSFMKLWSILITQAAVYTLDEGQEHEDETEDTAGQARNCRQPVELALGDIEADVTSFATGGIRCGESKHIRLRVLCVERLL